MQKLWKVVGRHKSPRIHILSDVHLETGPYEIPEGLEFDILIAAGDIGPIEHAVKWLASIGKPVVYVLGNHECWQHDFGDALALAKAAAKGTKVRVLEREAAVIQGVRFLGATLWTDFGDWNPGLVETAVWYMRDYSQITAHQWYEVKANRDWFRRQCRKIGMSQEAIQEWIAEGQYHPAIAYRAHTKTVDWLSHALSKEFDGPSVVVTHHAPTFDSLRESGVSEAALQLDYWQYHDRSLIKQAAYASRLEPLLKYRAGAIDLWVHGHIHHGFDILTQPARVICNPRGYALPPSRASSWLGNLVSQNDLDTSEERHLQNPYLGNGQGFDRHLVIDLMAGFERPLRLEIENPLASLREIRRDTAEVMGHLRRTQPRLREYLMRCVDQNIREFNGVLGALMDRINPALNVEQFALIASPHRLCEPLSSERTADSYALTLSDMDEWCTWLGRLPSYAHTRLEEWVKLSISMLSMLEDSEVHAWVKPPPMRLLRTLDIDMQDHIVVADFGGDETQLNAWSMRLLEAFCSEMPRMHFVSLWHLSDAENDRPGRLLSLADLRSTLTDANEDATICGDIKPK